jgi:hypothetical protein
MNNQDKQLQFQVLMEPLFLELQLLLLSMGTCILIIVPRMLLSRDRGLDHLSPVTLTELSLKLLCIEICVPNLLLRRRLSKGVDYLVEASAAEAEAISATLAAVKARQVNGEMEHSPDREQSPDAASSGKQTSSLIKPDPALLNNSTPPPGVRLHHRAVRCKCS